MNIILIGFRCTGKTTLSRLLAKKLNWNLMSIDVEIEKREKKDINNIVKNYGWRYFRKVEKKIIEELKGINNTVIDTGGGSIIFKSNREILKNLGFVVLVDANTKDIIERIKKSNDRPRLKKNVSIEKEIKLLINSRKKKYLEICDMKINSSRITAKAAVNLIVNNIKKIM